MKSSSRLLRRFASGRARVLSLALTCSLALMAAASVASAQAAPGAIASTAHEAPGAPLAVLPSQGAPSGMPTEALSAAPSSPSGDAASSRSMAFAAGGMQCRDTVPGGTLLVLAYAAVLALLGLYTTLLAAKNARLSTAVLELEREIARRSPARTTDDEGDRGAPADTQG